VGTVTRYGLDGRGIESGGGDIFRTRPDRPWGPPSSLYNGYRVFLGGKLVGASRVTFTFTDSQLTCQNWPLDSYISYLHTCPDFDVLITFVASVCPSVREALK